MSYGLLVGYAARTQYRSRGGVMAILAKPVTADLAVKQNCHPQEQILLYICMMPILACS